MKLVIIFCLVAIALARPQAREEDINAEIVRSDATFGEDPAAFVYGFELTNGITADKEGYPGEKGQSNMRGTFVIPYEDGSVGNFEYVADERGYRIISSSITKA